jgi:hypothetical protein
MQLSCSGVNNQDETKFAKPGKPENQDPTQNFQHVVTAASKSFICLANVPLGDLGSISRVAPKPLPLSNVKTQRAPSRLQSPDRPDHRTSWPLPRHFHFHSPPSHETRYIRPTDCESSKTLHFQLAGFVIIPATRFLSSTQETRRSSSPLQTTLCGRRNARVHHRTTTKTQSPRWCVS